MKVKEPLIGRDGNAMVWNMGICNPREFLQHFV